MRAAFQASDTRARKGGKASAPYKAERQALIQWMRVESDVAGRRSTVVEVFADGAGACPVARSEAMHTPVVAHVRVDLPVKCARQRREQARVLRVSSRRAAFRAAARLSAVEPSDHAAVYRVCNQRRASPSNTISAKILQRNGRHVRADQADICDVDGEVAWV